MALIAAFFILAFLAVFCYEVGCSANSLLPGRGNSMLGLGASAAVFTTLVAMNIVLLTKGRPHPKQEKKRKR
jgi:hypothetical protein